jgi:hypothetical protein
MEHKRVFLARDVTYEGEDERVFNMGTLLVSAV